MIPVETVAIPACGFLGFIVVNAFGHPLETAEIVRYFEAQVDEYIMFILGVRAGIYKYWIERVSRNGRFRILWTLFLRTSRK